MGSRNWNQLKQDLEEQVLDPAQNGDLAEQEHFFGPVVVAEQSGDPRFKIFDIIDGQQRFTTVYLMLAYFRRRLETLLSKAPKAREHYDTTGQWLINRTDVRQARDDYWRIKLFSVKGDRLARTIPYSEKTGTPRRRPCRKTCTSICRTATYPISSNVGWGATLVIWEKKASGIGSEP